MEKKVHCNNMARGRPVRSCTKTSTLYSDARKNAGCTNNGIHKKDGISVKKTQSITDYFQAVDISADKTQEKFHSLRLTRRNAAVNSLSQLTLKKNCRKAQDFVEELENKYNSPVAKTATNMTLNGVKSPPTPHRITLCTEVQEERQNGKAEVKNFQKPTTAPKARRKLNNNRPHILEENPLSTNNHKLTDYFPVRRSVRKTKTTVLEEKQRSLEKALRNNIEEGLKICYFDEKGRGIVADKLFNRGDFVVEYSGDLIDISEAKRREEMYAMDQNMGCYMYYFKHNNQQYCIDATPESDRLGRLVNHSRNGNLLTRSISVDGKPRLVLIAKEDIQPGEEILYDYGDRSKESLRHHPWLAN